MLAVDLGYAQVKGRAGDKTVKYASVVGNPSVFNLEDDYSQMDAGIGRMEIVYKGTTYLAGYGALKYTSNARLTLKADKSNSDTNVVKFLAAAGALGVQGDVSVVTGIPIFQYQTQKDALMASLMGAFVFQYNGQPYRIEVKNVKVIPQGAGVYYSLVIEDGKIVRQDLAVSRVAIVDCGSNNTNIISMEQAKYDARTSGTLGTGVWAIFSELQRRINEKYQVFYKLTEVETLAKMGYMDLYSQHILLDDVIRQSVEPVAQELIEGFTAIVGDYRKLTGGIVLAGGGACLMKKHFAQEFGEDIITVADDPEFANVNGYYQYGLLTTGR
jgi:hypothetical protein